MTTALSSFPAVNSLVPLSGYGGRISAQRELPITNSGDRYKVEGSGTVVALPCYPPGVMVFLECVTEPNFTHSNRLICPGAVNLVCSAGDLVIAFSEGDGVWRLFCERVALASVMSPQCRVSLVSGLPIMPSDQGGATRDFTIPFGGQAIPLWDGARFRPADMGGELFQDTTDTTKSPAAVAANSIYDKFFWMNDGVPRSTRGYPWASSTARGTGAASTELELLKGVYVNKYDITNGPAARRGTFVASIASNGSATIDWLLGSSANGGGAARACVWNLGNRRKVDLAVNDSNASWTFTSATAGPLDPGGTGSGLNNRATFLSGLQEDGFTARHMCRIIVTGSAFHGVALNSTTALDAQAALVVAGSTVVAPNSIVTKTYKPVLGLNFIQAMQKGDGTNSGGIVGAADQELSVSLMA